MHSSEALRNATHGKAPHNDSLIPNPVSGNLRETNTTGDNLSELHEQDKDLYRVFRRTLQICWQSKGHIALLQPLLIPVAILAALCLFYPPLPLELGGTFVAATFFWRFRGKDRKLDFAVPLSMYFRIYFIRLLRRITVYMTSPIFPLSIYLYGRFCLADVVTVNRKFDSQEYSLSVSWQQTKSHKMFAFLSTLCLLLFTSPIFLVPFGLFFYFDIEPDPRRSGFVSAMAALTIYDWVSNFIVAPWQIAMHEELSTGETLFEEVFE